jgi:NAD(P)-dependent dehydrogenase (short-subunit alcohol dehydrogenase family)
MNSNDTNDVAYLRGQVVLVTGGGRGLGRAYAEALAAARAQVVVVARSRDQLDETVASITANGGQALAIPADVTDPHAVMQVVATVEQQLGPIDLLINNAAIVSPLGPLWELDPDEWWRSMDINVRGILLCTRAVLPGMIARRRGRIINVASGAGTGAIAYGSAYVTSKTAVIRLTETVALETKPYGVQLFAIDPGTVRTAMTEYLVESPAGQRWAPWFRTVFEDGQDVPAAYAVQLIRRVAAGEADQLSGRFISVHDDLDRLLQRVEEIGEKELYTLRITRLPASTTN